MSAIRTGSSSAPGILAALLVCVLVSLAPTRSLSAQAAGCAASLVSQGCAAVGLANVASDTAPREWIPRPTVAVVGHHARSSDAWEGAKWGTIVGAVAGGAFCALTGSCTEEGGADASVLASALTGSVSGALLGALIGAIAGAVRRS